jgi:hypothetical protein
VARSYVFGRRGEQSQWPPITEIINFTKSQLSVTFPVVFLNILKTAECRKSEFFISRIHFAAHFAAPLTLPPRAAAPFATP